MSKLIKLSIAALAILAIALPAVAQEGKERTVSLKHKHAQGEIHTEDEEESGKQTIELGGGVATRISDEVSVKQKVTEVLEVDETGKITKARVTWKVDKTTTTMQDFGEEAPGDPTEADGAKKDAKILYTWNKEKKAWESKLENGDAEDSDIKKELKHQSPFTNPLIPGRDVKVGEEWVPSEEDLKAAFPTPETLEATTMKATCKAEEIVKEDGKELLRVSFVMEMGGKIKDESMDNPEFSGTNTGSYFWDIAESRVVRVEAEQVMAFEAEVTTPQGKIAAKFDGNGKSVIKMTYGKAEKGN